ncbi:uncharacterized protein [Aegilops tauschii subsp. strangulata]|uniref:uncharacterized protein isoform X2 n=1 Tax=Aegilops tauschii subsp. strangulata TaxID=200361 RepID=UPI003CC8CF31
MHAQKDAGQDVFSWAFLRTRMKAIWAGFGNQQAAIAAVPFTASSSSSYPDADPSIAAKPLHTSRTPSPAPASPLCAGVTFQRPMAGVPPTAPGAAATGGPNPRPPPAMGPTPAPSRPPAQAPGYSGRPHQQHGLAPVYNYAPSMQQPPVYVQGGQYVSPYGTVVAGGQYPMYGVPSTGVSALPQFHPGGVVPQPAQKRKKKKKKKEAAAATVCGWSFATRVDGIQMNVPSVNAQMTVTAWRSQEVPHKLELQQIWLHVEGVPHTVRHFWGLWAVGTLMGKTLDVDLLSLCRRGVVRILVAMTNSQILSKENDDAGPFAATDVVVKLKGYTFSFRREPAGYIPDPNFVPFVWRRKGDDADDDSGAKEKDNEMDTSEYTGNPSNHPSSSNTNVTQVQRRELPTVGSGGATGGGPVLLAVIPFNSAPQTPRGMELAADLRVNSTLPGCLERSPRVHRQELSSPSTLQAVVALQLSSHSRPASSQSAALRSEQVTGGSAGRPDSSAVHLQPAAKVASQSPSSTRTAASKPAVPEPVEAAGGTAHAGCRHPVGTVEADWHAAHVEIPMHATHACM